MGGSGPLHLLREQLQCPYHRQSLAVGDDGLILLGTPLDPIAPFFLSWFGTTPQGGGGAIKAYGRGSLTITNSVFIGQQARVGGCLFPFRGCSALPSCGLCRVPVLGPIRLLPLMRQTNTDHCPKTINQSIITNH